MSSGPPPGAQQISGGSPTDIIGSIFNDISAVVTAPIDAIKDVVSFLQWISWLFNPINWLRMVEFLMGTLMMTVGFMRSTRYSRQVSSQVREVVQTMPGIGPKLVKGGRARSVAKSPPVPIE